MDKNEKQAAEGIKKLMAEYQVEVKDSINNISTNIFKKGATPAEAMRVSKGKMEGIYAQAYQLYNAGNFKKAFEAFDLLHLLNGRDPRFTFGMAASLQALKDYKRSFNLYLMSAQLDQENPVPFYHAIDCCLQEKDKISALVMCQLVIDKSKDREEYSYIKARAEVLKEKLTEEVNEQGKELTEKFGPKHD